MLPSNRQAMRFSDWRTLDLEKSSSSWTFLTLMRRIVSSRSSSPIVSTHARLCPASYHSSIVLAGVIHCAAERRPDVAEKVMHCAQQVEVSFD